MTTESKSKVYGLSFPTRKSKDDTVKRIESVFNTNSDDEEDIHLKPLEIKPVSRITAAKLNRKTKADFEKALEEDPSIFEYDEIYEDICNQKVEKTIGVIGTAKKESRYVNRLIKTASERKLERELCSERKAHKDIEAEAHLYGDKETFVTSAYKNKLSELDELVNRRKEEEARESYMDITKQEGLGGFYRYMYQHDTKSVPPEQATSSSANDCRTSAAEHSSTEQCDGQKTNIKTDSEKQSKLVNEDDNETSSSVNGPTDPSDKQDSIARSSGSHSAKRSTAPPTTTSSSGTHSRKSDVNWIQARPRVTSDEQLAEARKRYLSRKAAGIHPRVVDSDSD